ncbi:hypothetical protein HYPSUDRAFT_54178 [Hypholoma sublateritium FD-334 SS-4]|uniref:Uncharacterized protein n=1 Tax=Hypholoma sublateritium (strain FD-334 SS-4) TaxID=945553 RepID=A0A0D2NYF1_HYPSF|nr:hypothetical protein HYPSUDRAFT_54178 [Hypholoma sublateritium FD-334 SS-4]
MEITFTPLETLGLLAFLRGHASILPNCLADLPSKLATSLEANAEMLSLADFGLLSPINNSPVTALNHDESLRSPEETLIEKLVPHQSNFEMTAPDHSRQSSPRLNTFVGGSLDEDHPVELGMEDQGHYKENQQDVDREPPDCDQNSSLILGPQRGLQGNGRCRRKGKDKIPEKKFKKRGDVSVKPTKQTLALRLLRKQRHIAVQEQRQESYGHFLKACTMLLLAVLAISKIKTGFHIRETMEDVLIKINHTLRCPEPGDIQQSDTFFDSLLFDEQFSFIVKPRCKTTWSSCYYPFPQSVEPIQYHVMNHMALSLAAIPTTIGSIPLDDLPPMSPLTDLDDESDDMDIMEGLGLDPPPTIYVIETKYNPKSNINVVSKCPRTANSQDIYFDTQKERYLAEKSQVATSLEDLKKKFDYYLGSSI